MDLFPTPFEFVPLEKYKDDHGAQACADANGEMVADHCHVTVSGHESKQQCEDFGGHLDGNVCKIGKMALTAGTKIAFA